MSVTAETNGDEVTSWIPLTTVFTPSSGCESVFRLNGPSLVAFDPGYGLDIDPAVKCAPSAVTTWWEQARLGVGGVEHTAISIQPLTCPHLWTTVATYIKDSSTTQIMCCPSGYSNPRATSGSVNGDCLSSVSKGMVLTYASTAAGVSTDWSMVTTTLSASSNVGAIAVVGFNVARVTSTATADSSAGLTTASSDFSSRLSTSSFSDERSSPTGTAPSNSSSDDGLSTGAKVGIGLGASLGILGIGALILTVFLHRCRRKNRSSERQAAAAPVATFGVEDKTSGVAPHDFTQEIYGRPVFSELPSGQVHSPVELDTQGWSR